MKKVVAIIQARVGSTRLPGKILKDVSGKPILWHVVERLRSCKQIDTIVIATTKNSGDRKLVEFAKEEELGFFMGSENDVLSRFVGAAKKYGADVIVRVCSDVPLIDPNELDRLIIEIKKSNADIISFTEGVETIHQGFEVFSSKALSRIDDKSKKTYEREHVIAYFKEHETEFEVAYIKPAKAFERQHVRLSVDTPADLEFIREIYSRLYKPGTVVDLKKVLKLFDKNPKILDINKCVKQKKFTSEEKRVLFRVDASSEIGFGHLSRMIHLAKHLRDEKHCGVLFVSKSNRLALRKISASSIPLKRLSTGLNASEENKKMLKTMQEFKPDVVVFDLKNSFSAKLVSELKKQGVLTVSVDNASKAALECDINVIPTAHFTPDNKWINYKGRLYYGPEYVILAPAFSKKRRRVSHGTPRVLISCGGTDPQNLTLKVLKSLMHVECDFKAIIILGLGYKYKNQIHKFIQKLTGQFVILEDASDMRDLMYKSDISILAFGITTYEAAATGLPAIIITTSTRNQKSMQQFIKYKTCVNGGHIHKLDEKTLAKKFTQLLKNPKLQKVLSQNGHRLIDGRGIIRVAEIISTFKNEKSCNSRGKCVWIKQPKRRCYVRGLL